jgi:hypothetical protein
MKVPAWLKDIRTQGILPAIFVLLVFILYVAHAQKYDLANPSKPIIPFSLASSTLFYHPSPATTSPARLYKKNTSLEASMGSASLSTTSQSQNAAVSEKTAAQDLSASGATLLKSIVNIVCLSGDPSIPSISGSGVIIDPRGIIITAAHVAQLFLLQDYLGTNKVECIVRTGSPARRAYFAEPIYVSPSWVTQNPQTLTQKSPMGTGENDFAFLGITGTATSTPLASSFPFIPLSSTDLQIKDPVAIGSYGAQYLTSEEINKDLYPILVFGSIQNRYTFEANTVDLVSILGSAASQEGSSGGGVANARSQLGAIITTSTIAGNISDRSLNAITISHIRRSFFSDTGSNLDTVLESNSVPSLIANFANESKILGQKLMVDISSNP